MLIINNNTPNPTEYEIIIRDSYALVRTDIQAALDKADVYDKIGRKELARIEFDKINYYHYVIYYCVLIRMYIIERLSNDEKVTWDELNEKYKLDCVRDTLGCKGIKVKKILDYFSFNKNFGSDEPTGIEYFTLEVGNKVFKVS